MCGIVWTATAVVVCSKCAVCVNLYLLVLSDSFLLLLDPLEFYSVRAVSPRNNVAFWAVCTANLTARPRWFVNESARRTRPTLRTKISCFHFMLNSFFYFHYFLFLLKKPSQWAAVYYLNRGCFRTQCLIQFGHLQVD